MQSLNSADYIEKAITDTVKNDVFPEAISSVAASVFAIFGGPAIGPIAKYTATVAANYLTSKKDSSDPEERIRNAFTVIEDKSKQRRVAKDFYILNIYKTNSEDSQLIAETKKIDILDYEKQYAKLEDEIRKRNYWTEKTLLTDFEYLN